MAAALAHQKGLVTSGPTDATVAGIRVQQVTLSLPSDFDVTSCDGDELKLWHGLGSVEPQDEGIARGQTTTVAIVNVSGNATTVVTRLRNDSPPGDVAELAAILDSLEFGPPSAEAY